MAKGLTRQGYTYVMKLSLRFNSFASVWVVSSYKRSYFAAIPEGSVVQMPFPVSCAW